MASCGAKAVAGQKPLTEKQAAAKLARGLQFVFVKVQEVKTLHMKMRSAASASSEKSECQKAKGKAEAKCQDVLASVVNLVGDFKAAAKAESPIAQQFFQEVIEQKDNYKGLKTYFNKTITPMLGEYEKVMEDYVRLGNRRVKCDYESFVKELAVHLAKAYTTIFVEHSRYGKYFFERPNGKK